MKLFVVVSAVLVAVVVGEEKMQDQCMCSVLNPCIEAGYENVEVCANKCKSHFTDLGGDWDKANKCLHKYDDKIKKGTDCVRKALGDVCTDKEGQKVPQRHHETLQLAAAKEITEMVKKSGLLGKTADLFEIAKKGAACMIKCGQASSCAKKLGCGVALPPDNDIVAIVKKCALEAGANTELAKEACNCVLDAGIKRLESICPMIKVIP